MNRTTFYFNAFIAGIGAASEGKPGKMELLDAEEKNGVRIYFKPIVDGKEVEFDESKAETEKVVFDEKGEP